MPIQKKYFGITLIISLLFCAGCGTKKTIDKVVSTVVADTIPVKTLELVPKTFIELGEYYGKVSAYREAILVNYISGRVESIYAKEGSYVSVGKSLASIDVERVKNLLEIAELNERLSKEQYERMQQHFNNGNASSVQVDQSHLAWLDAKSKHIDAKKTSDGARCISPLAGIVTSRYIELHQELAPGTPTFSICQLHKMKIRVGIPEGDMAGVKEGNGVVVTFAQFPNRSWDGTIIRLTREASKERRSFLAQIVVDNKDHTILPGITAYVELQRRSLVNAVVVPTSSILTEGNMNYAMVASNNMAVKHLLVLGPSDRTHTVIEDGLIHGVQLIVEGQHIVSNGAFLKIIQ